MSSVPKWFFFSFRLKIILLDFILNEKLFEKDVTLFTGLFTVVPYHTYIKCMDSKRSMEMKKPESWPWYYILLFHCRLRLSFTFYFFYFFELHPLPHHKAIEILMLLYSFFFLFIVVVFLLILFSSLIVCSQHYLFKILCGTMLSSCCKSNT